MHNHIPFCVTPQMLVPVFAPPDPRGGGPLALLKICPFVRMQVRMSVYLSV